MGELQERTHGQALVGERLPQWNINANHVGTQSSDVATGEGQVATLLEQLGDGWTVLHGISTGRGKTEIDNIVIGPSGVFTIHANYSQSKRVWVDDLGMYVGGLRESFVYNAASDTERVGELLSAASGIAVRPVGLIVLMNPAKPNLNALAGGDLNSPEIHVIADGQLLAAIHREPIFSADEVVRIADAAVRTDTWTQSLVSAVGAPQGATRAGAPSAAIDNDQIARDFEALQLSLSLHRRRKLSFKQLATEFAVPLISIGLLIGIMNWLGR
jgi:Nuclease-related domain